MPSPQKKCVLTGYTDSGINFLSKDGPIVEYEFMPIGKAKFAAPTYISLQNQDKPQPVLAGICRNRFDEKEEPILIDSNFLHSGIHQYPYPQTFYEKALHLLKFMYNHGGRESKTFDFHSYTEWPLCYCENEDEFDRIIDYLYHDKASIRYTAKPSPGEYHVKLSISGIGEIEKEFAKNDVKDSLGQIESQPVKQQFNHMPNKYDRAVEQLKTIKSPYDPFQGYKPMRSLATNIVEIYGDEVYKKRFHSMVTFNHIGDIRSDEEKHRLVTVAIDSAIHFFQNKSTMEEDKLNDSVVPFDSKKVFIVHGRNDGAKESLARTIEKIGLDPIILHEQANHGKTLIEKFEHYSNVGFAIILLTDDDLGKAKDDADLNKRARQNVVFEMGFFFGKLSRSRVVTLYAKGIELPSDLNGLVYIELDHAGAWKLAMAKELKQAGYNVDFGRL